MYHQIDPRKIKPQGWLLRQLQIQAAGLSGNLDKIWPDVKDSAWIGGGREGWERVPYWLDGFIPLAWFLDDKDMKERAERYIHAIVGRQKKDGWICPGKEEEREAYDVWALFLIGKVFVVYWEFTGCELVKESLYKAMRCLYRMMKEQRVTLFDWGKFRWFECLIPLQFLYEQYHEQWIMELGEILRKQGVNYPDYEEKWKRPLNQWTYETHAVNLAMMLKYEALGSWFFGETYGGEAEQLWDTLVRYNGTAVGTITGDECLSGVKNNQGTELCCIVELMYSFELLYTITGNPVWMDRLEKTAFNAFPAAISDDMWTHQYDQQVNQIACVRFPGKSYFRTNGKDAGLFGLEPHFGCCTANLHQGWPKLTWNIFQQDKDEVECALMLPASLETRISGVNVKITIITEYPFWHTGQYIVEAEQPVEFGLKIRIPGWSKQYEADGNKEENHGYFVKRQRWGKKQVITVRLFEEPHLVSRPSGLKTAEYGPLVFALPIAATYKMHEYERDGVERRFPYCDYELSPASEWRFGYQTEQMNVCRKEGDDVPFSSAHPRVTMEAVMQPVEWGYEDGYDTVAAVYPKGEMREGSPRVMELYPYGCAKLRMTELPLVSEHKIW